MLCRLLTVCHSLGVTADGPLSFQELLPVLLVRWGLKTLSTAGRALSQSSCLDLRGVGRGHSRLLSVSQTIPSVRKSLEHVCYKLTKGLLHFESYLNSVPHWKESFQMGKNFVILNASEGNGLYGWRVQRCDFAEQGCLSHIACFYDVTVWA